MKLNYKRTIFVGFAFFLICAFWQAYDNTIPLILTNKFGLSQTASGVVMALDNVLALFMLPIFGAISDKCRSPRGKRTPFILIGTLAAAVIFVSLSFVDNAQLRNIRAVSAIDDPAALHTIYQKEADSTLMTPDGDSYVLRELFTEEEFVTIRSQLILRQGEISPADAPDTAYALRDRFTQSEQHILDNAAADKPVANPHYTNYVVPARQAYSWQVTAESPITLVFFLLLLLLVLLSMSVFRSPAVALMPDVTIKPLRSKANAVINLMGSAGGILVLVLGMVFATGAVRNSLMSYTVYFAVIAGLMLMALTVFMWKVREPQFVREMHEDSRRYGLEEEAEQQQNGRLSKPERRSLLFLLASIVLWFMGYNAVTSKYSVYATNILNKDYNFTLIIAQAAAILAYLPVGFIASKVGRKKTIFAGILMLATSFGIASFLNSGSSTLLMNAMFALAGIGWATINVNSFPMVVEMCRGGNVGKFTGIYYTASMAAQTVTPMFSGFLMDKLGMTSLFPYATCFVALAFVTMLFVRHGDSRPVSKKGLEALDTDD